MLPQGAYRVLGRRNRVEERPPCGSTARGGGGQLSCGGRQAGCLSEQTQGSVGVEAQGSGHPGERPGLCLLGPGARWAGVPLFALLRSSYWNLQAATTCPTFAFSSQDLLSIPQKFPQVNVYVYIFTYTHTQTHTHIYINCIFINGFEYLVWLPVSEQYKGRKFCPRWGTDEAPP